MNFDEVIAHIDAQLEAGPVDDYNANRYVRCEHCKDECDWHGVQCENCGCTQIGEGVPAAEPLPFMQRYSYQEHFAPQQDRSGYTIADIEAMRSERRWERTEESYGDGEGGRITQVRYWRTNADGSMEEVSPREVAFALTLQHVQRMMNSIVGIELPENPYLDPREWGLDCPPVLPERLQAQNLIHDSIFEQNFVRDPEGHE